MRGFSREKHVARLTLKSLLDKLDFHPSGSDLTIPPPPVADEVPFSVDEVDELEGTVLSSEAVQYDQAERTKGQLIAGLDAEERRDDTTAPSSIRRGSHGDGLTRVVR